MEAAAAVDRPVLLATSRGDPGQAPVRHGKNTGSEPEKGERVLPEPCFSSGNLGKFPCLHIFSSVRDVQERVSALGTERGANSRFGHKVVPSLLLRFREAAAPFVAWCLGSCWHLHESTGKWLPSCAWPTPRTARGGGEGN